MASSGDTRYNVVKNRRSSAYVSDTHSIVTVAKFSLYLAGRVRFEVSTGFVGGGTGWGFGF